MMTNGELMTDILTAIPFDSTVREATKKMRYARIDSLLVEKNHEFVGIVTEQDIVRKVCGMERDPATTSAFDIMSSPIISVDAHAPLRDALSIMAGKGIRHVAVTKGGKISGSLSVLEVLGYMQSVLSAFAAQKSVGAL